MKKSAFAAEFLLAQFLSIERTATLAGFAPLERCASGHAIVNPDCPACRVAMDRIHDQQPCGWCRKVHPNTEHCERCSIVGGDGLLGCDCGAADQEQA
jgi:hypothetical protein